MLEPFKLLLNCSSVSTTSSGESTRAGDVDNVLDVEVDEVVTVDVIDDLGTVNVVLGLGAMVAVKVVVTVDVVG